MKLMSSHILFLLIIDKLRLDEVSINGKGCLCANRQSDLFFSLSLSELLTCMASRILPNMVSNFKLN